MTHAPTFAFGPFVLIPLRQLLLRHGQPVRVGCRALDLLTAFVQHPGELLTKRELMDEAWPSTTVVEGNLKVTIAALRRALEDDADAAMYIATVNGRGYRFIAPVQTGDAATNLPAAAAQLPKFSGEAQSAPIGFMDGRSKDFVTLLARAMRSAVIDLPLDTELREPTPVPRRILCIELAAQDESWIETIFSQPQSVVSATL